MMKVNQCIKKAMDFVVYVKFELPFIPWENMLEKVSVGKQPYNFWFLSSVISLIILINKLTKNFSDKIIKPFTRIVVPFQTFS